MQAQCPVCQRYTGPAKMCPYCETPLPQPWLHKKLLRGTWLVAILGLCLLILAARLHPPQTLPIADITPTMQFAQLYFEGQITHKPRVSRNHTSASTNLDDGSGQILRMVFLDEALTALLDNTEAFQAGTHLHVSGGLRIRADEPPVLFIRNTNQFRLLE